MTDKVSYLLQGDTLVVVVDSQTHTVGRDHRNFGMIVEALKAEEYDGIIDLISMDKAITNFSRGLMTVVDGEVFYDGDLLHPSLQERMLDMIDGGFPVDPLIAFIGNLFQNPSKIAVDELYLFLEGNDLPITTDGHFLAYKNVRDDYTDKHSGTFDNSVGSVCEMPRNKVQDDRDITCSDGLHFCSLGYLKSFHGEHTMILKINPADVVSIPSDYSNTKGRTCRYEVVGEHIVEDRYNTEAFDQPVQDNVSDDTRRVVCVDRTEDLALTFYDNLEQAATDVGCPSGYIRRVLIGDREATKGYRWMYEDDWNDYVVADLSSEVLSALDGINGDVWGDNNS
jgi:hypothetical protein